MIHIIWRGPLTACGFLALVQKKWKSGLAPSGFAVRDRQTEPAEVLTAAIWSTPSLVHTYDANLYEWTQPPKNAFYQPQETRTTGTDAPPTLQASPGHPRGRACPVGRPSAAPIPVDAGHRVWGACRRVETLPYKPWRAVIEIMRRK